MYRTAHCRVALVCMLLFMAGWLRAQSARILQDIRPGVDSSLPGVSDVPASGLVSLNGKVYFFAQDRVGPANLWESDGTVEGTVKVVDLGGSCLPGRGGVSFCFPANLVASGGFLYFANVGSTGVELWRSDGTRGGTGIFRDINDGPGHSLFVPGDNGGYFGSLTDAAGRLFFIADNGIQGQSLWTSDGTDAGTFLVKNGASKIATAVGADVFFFDGPSFWVSDGTTAGTRFLKRFSGAIGEVVAAQGQLILAADDGQGSELWRATVNGTEQFLDLVPGVNGSEPDDFTDVGGVVYFSARDEVNGFAIWRTDGTAAGTRLVKDPNPTAGTGDPADRRPGALHSANGLLYFAADDGVHGFEPWTSDGTEVGTKRLADIRVGPEGSMAASGGGVSGQFFAAGGTVWMVADDGVRGRELWQTDGPGAGAELAADVLPGAGSGDPRAFAFVNRTLVFTAVDGRENGSPLHGIELFALAVGDACREAVVIDNGAPGTSATGLWKVSNAAGALASSSLWNRGSVGVVPSYSFEASLTPAAYEVFEWHSVFSGRSRAVRHVIAHAGGTSAILVDQSVGGGRWNSLGVFTFSGKGLVTIRAEDRELSTNADAIRFVCRTRALPTAVILGIAPRPARAGETVCFDGAPGSGANAVAFEWTSSLQPGVLLSSEPSFCRSDLVPGDHQVFFRVRDLNGEWSLPTVERLLIEGRVDECGETIVDNRSLNARALVGIWQASATQQSFGDGSVWAKPPSASLPHTFEFKADLTPGFYEVYEWHSVWSTRSRAVEHVITGGNQTSTVIVDQSIDGGRWNSLGTFSFAGPSTVTIRATDTQRSTNADAILFVCRESAEQ